MKHFAFGLINYCIAFLLVTAEWLFFSANLIRPTHTVLVIFILGERPIRDTHFSNNGISIMYSSNIIHTVSHLNGVIRIRLLFTDCLSCIWILELKWLEGRHVTACCFSHLTKHLLLVWSNLETEMNTGSQMEGPELKHSFSERRPKLILSPHAYHDMKFIVFEMYTFSMVPQ